MALPTFHRIAYGEDEAAALCSVGVEQIRAWVHEGVLIAHYSGARASKPLYLPEDLAEAVRSLPTSKGGGVSGPAQGSAGGRRG